MVTRKVQKHRVLNPADAHLLPLLTFSNKQEEASGGLIYCCTFHFFFLSVSKTGPFLRNFALLQPAAVRKADAFAKNSRKRRKKEKQIGLQSPASILFSSRRGEY